MVSNVTSLSSPFLSEACITLSVALSGIDMSEKYGSLSHLTHQLQTSLHNQH